MIFDTECIVLGSLKKVKIYALLSVVIAAFTSSSALEKYVINPVMLTKNISSTQAIVLTKITTIYSSSEINVLLKWSTVTVR